MDNLPEKVSSRQVAIWLLTGVFMIIVQVMLGGITRLTESGLSITEWKPITGALPPLNDAAWLAEFEKYKLTDQFKYLHQDFSLHEFKFIFFWEWFHRLWARLMGLVFLTGFVFFLVKGKFNRGMIRPMIVLFLLGALQGAIGWVMVKSGLVPEKYFVGHVELAVHFIAAMGLLCYTLWFALSLLIRSEQRAVHADLKNFLLFLLAVLILQLIYGAFMAGLKAAVAAPTWPDINGSMVPSAMNELSPWTRNLVSNTIAIQFIHRCLAYLLLIMSFAWWIKAKAVRGNKLFRSLRHVLLVLVLFQVVLGIFTLLNATYPDRLVLLGVSHQFVAMMLLMTMMVLLFVVRKRP